MTSQKKRTIEITPGQIIFAILIIAFVAWMFYAATQNPANSDWYRESRSNAGKHYTETEYKYYAACQEAIMGTIEHFGDDQGYFCYESTNNAGERVYRVGNAYK